MTRLIDACSHCGSQVEYDAAGPCCAGAAIIQVALVRSADLRPAPWTQADEDRWQARLTAERALIAAGGAS